MKTEILELRSKGKSYNEIVLELGCSKGLVAYHCGPGVKDKSLVRQQKFRLKNKLVTRVDAFQNNKSRKLSDASRNFNRLREYGKYLPEFSGLRIKPKEVLEKFGKVAKCYLTGEEFNLLEDSGYSIDHIIAYSKGGLSTIDNMGILNSKINVMKGKFEVEEFIELCKKVALYNK